MDLQLTDKVAIVTGASKGVGLATTGSLLGEGARVLAVSRSRTPELAALESPRLLHVQADLVDPSAPALVVEKASEAFGGLDILVNNAGGQPAGVPLPRSSFLDASASDWEAVFDFNLFSVVRMIRAALPLLLERGGGSIVNVSSTNARHPAPMNVDYGAAKAAMSNLGKALSEEFGPQGVRVNTVSPGPVRTPWWTSPGGAADRIAGMTGSDAQTVLTKLAPEMMRLTTGRLVEPEEVADVIALLASPRSASTTGADFTVDAGMLKQV